MKYIDGSLSIYLSLKKEKQKQKIITAPEFTDQCEIKHNYRQAPELNITENGSNTLLQKLHPYKTAGPDGIRPTVLKELSDINHLWESQYM